MPARLSMVSEMLFPGVSVAPKKDSPKPETLLTSGSICGRELVEGLELVFDARFGSSNLFEVVGRRPSGDAGSLTGSLKFKASIPYSLFRSDTGSNVSLSR